MLKSWLYNIKNWYWVFASFFVPCCAYPLVIGASPSVAVRAGLLGLLLALLIYVLWKATLRMHGFIMPEKYGDLVMTAFGIILWVVWFCVAQVILIAYDELNDSGNTTMFRLEFPFKHR